MRSFRSDGSYPGGVVSIQALRARLPFVVFVLILLLAVMLIGFACACITDHPSQAVDRAISAIPAATPVTEVWSLLVLTLLGGMTLILTRPRSAQSRGSPALLQRFLL